jgi:hypothetical protein
MPVSDLVEHEVAAARLRVGDLARVSPDRTREITGVRVNELTETVRVELCDGAVSLHPLGRLMRVYRPAEEPAQELHHVCDGGHLGANHALAGPQYTKAGSDDEHHGNTGSNGCVQPQSTRTAPVTDHDARI